MTWFLDTMIAVSMLCVAVLMIRRPIARLFGARWAYALWLLPVLRAALPPLPDLGDRISSALSPPAFIPPAGEVSAPLQAAAAGSAQWLGPIIAIWALGAALFIVWQLISYRHFVERLKVARLGTISLFEGLVVMESDAVDGPLAVGLFDRRIVVPLDFLGRYSPAEQRLALEHEATHHRRGDIWWNVAALLLLAINWFNPLAYLAFRAFRADQELSCDAAVASSASSSERHDYALAMVKSISGPRLVAACPLNHKGQLKRRLKMMNQHRASRGRTAGGLATVALALLGGLFLSAPTAAREEAPAKHQFFFSRVDEPAGARRIPVDFKALRAKCGPAAANLEKEAKDIADGKKPIRIIFCGRHGTALSPELAASLTDALAKAGSNGGVPTEAETRHQVAVVALRSLRREIDRGVGPAWTRESKTHRH
jgi:beta-lactamase regulating signal transducer with metallopeptidase domain